MKSIASIIIIYKYLKMRKKYRRNTAGIWAGEGMPLIEAVYLLFLFQDIQKESRW